jgi:hypothetical protein
MNTASRSKLRAELRRICRVVDFAEEHKTAENFIVVRRNILDVERTFNEIVAAELAAQLAGLFVNSLPAIKENVPTSE